MRRGIDVGIIVEPEDVILPSFDTRVLALGEYRVIVQKESPLAARECVCYADLAKERWILYRSTFRLPMMVQAGCEAAGFSPKVILTASQPEFMLSLVSQGFGITVQAWPEGAPETYWDNLVALPITDMQSRYAVKLITLRDSYIPPAACSLVDFAEHTTF